MRFPQTLPRPRLKREKALRRAEHTREFLSSDALISELRKEMSRSDRTGSPLTLVFFDVRDASGPEIEEHEAELALLARVMNESLRNTDVKGWSRDARGVLQGIDLYR